MIIIWLKWLFIKEKGGGASRNNENDKWKYFDINYIRLFIEHSISMHTACISALNFKIIGVSLKEATKKLLGKERVMISWYVVLWHHPDGDSSDTEKSS